MSDRLTEALEIMFEVMPSSQEATPRMIATYADRLSNLPEDAVREAIALLIDTKTFRPTIAEIRSTVAETSLFVRNKKIGEEAWQEVVQQASAVGFTENRPELRVFSGGRFHDPPRPMFSDPMIEKAAYLVGWRRICQHDVEKEGPFIRKEFLRIYGELFSAEVQALQSGAIALSEGEDNERAV